MMIEYTHVPKTYRPRDAIDQMETLTTAWHYADARLTECLFWLHHGARDQAYYLAEYLKALRQVSSYEEQMTALGIDFNRNPS